MPSIKVLFNNEQLICTQNLEKEAYVIGRQEGCDIQIDNLGVSRNHTRFRREGSGWCVEDMNSANGTFVNGSQIQQPHILQPNDEITIGKYMITYYAEEATADEKPEEDEKASVALPQLGDDALNTMAMDGDSIRKKIEEMHKQKESEEATVAPPVQPQAAPAQKSPQQTEQKARKTELVQVNNDVKTMKIVIAVIALIAVAAIVAVVILMSRS